MKEEYKVGERLLVKDGLFGCIFHAQILFFGKDWLGEYFIGKYRVNDNTMGHYETAKKFRRRHILSKA